MKVKHFSLIYDIICIDEQKGDKKIMYIYQRLKDLREDKDLNQKEVGEIIGTSGNYYGDYENGKRDIPTGRMITLANYYKVSMDYITGLTNDKGGLHKNTTAEQEILSKYNALSDIRKGRVLQLLDMLTEEQKQDNNIKENI